MNLYKVIIDGKVIPLEHATLRELQHVMKAMIDRANGGSAFINGAAGFMVQAPDSVYDLLPSDCEP